MNEERLKELEEHLNVYGGGLSTRESFYLINRVRELERALEQAVEGKTRTEAIVNAFLKVFEKEEV